MASTKHIRFDKYHRGPWPYPFEDGVGLAFSGNPTDAREFIEILQRESCSPVAAHRILAELEAGRTKFTTVRSHLDFNGIGDELATVGVTMAVVPPVEPQDQRYDLAALDLLVGRKVDATEFTAEELQLIEQRHLQTQASLARLPVDIGAFA